MVVTLGGGSIIITLSEINFSTGKHTVLLDAAYIRLMDAFMNKTCRQQTWPCEPADV